jgi:hypothetical protein
MNLDYKIASISCSAEFNLPVRMPHYATERHLRTSAMQLAKSGMTLHLDSALTTNHGTSAVDVIFLVGNQSLEMAVHRAGERKPFLESTIPFSQISADLLHEYEYHGEHDTKPFMIQKLYELLEAEGFQFTSRQIASRALEHIFDAWYQEEITARKIAERTYQSALELK